MSGAQARLIIRSLHYKDPWGWGKCVQCLASWPCDPSQDIWDAEQLARFAALDKQEEEYARIRREREEIAYGN